MVKLGKAPLLFHDQSTGHLDKEMKIEHFNVFLSLAKFFVPRTRKLFILQIVFGRLNNSPAMCIKA